MTPFEFDLPKDKSSIIKVFGVGGGGSNAVNHMYQQGIVGVNFVICNTDSQALEISPIPNKIQLGPELTQGLGAGANPQVGMAACEESIEEIKAILGTNTKMVFITAGMGGGTGTGAAPVVARIAREMGILTVGIVTTPFTFEGRKRYGHATEGINRLREHVDTILVIANDKIRQMYGNLTSSEAFNNANNILATAARSISEIITKPGIINVDFADVKTVMTNGGSAIMGCATAEGENRARIAVEAALNSPLLNDSDVRGAKNVLVNIVTGAKEMTMDEIEEINDYIQHAANDTDIILGTSSDMSLGDKLMVTVIATGFESKLSNNYAPAVKVKVYDLDNKAVAPEVLPADNTIVAVENANGKVEYKLDEELTITPVAEEIVVETTEAAETLTLSEELAVENLLIEDEGFDLFSTLGTDAVDNSIEFEVSTRQQFLTDDTYNQSEAPAFNNEVSNSEVTNNFSVETTNKEEESYTIFTRKIEDPVVNPVTDAAKSLEDRKKILAQLSNRSMGRNYSDLEKEPAYMRAGMNLNNNVASSNDKQLSRYTVNESGTDFSRPEIKRNNSFLTDKPD
jgi:cell division protein FtsZ